MTVHVTTAPPSAGPRTLHAICELTRLAACGYCPADGLDWPCTASGTGPDGEGPAFALGQAAPHAEPLAAV